MQKKTIVARIFSVLLVACMILPYLVIQPKAVTPHGEVLVKDYEITARLHREVTEQIYDGTYVDVVYDNAPQSGYHYLLVELEVIPSAPVAADDFKVQIGTTQYSRVIDDTFLENYEYNGLGHREIITKTSGWIVFAIPQSAQNPETWKIVNGDLSANLQQEDENLVQQEAYNGYAERQAELIAQYKANFAKGNYTPENPYIIVNPYETAPLTALVMFNTETPVEVTTTVVGKTDRTSITNTVSGYDTYHEVPIIGLYNGVNTVKMELKDQATGTVKTFTHQIKTEDMPDTIKNKGIKLVKANLEELSDELYFLKDATRTIVDINGDVRGYFPEFDIMAAGIDEMTDAGHFFCSSNAQFPYYVMYELDFMGVVYREVQLPYKMHHDALLQDDNSLAFMDYVMDLDTAEISTWIPWTEIFNDTNGSAEVRFHGSTDWLHNNTISWCGDDAVLVSSRNQHAVAKLSYPDFEVEWILSVNPNASPWNADKYLTPIGDDFEWFYSQHHVQLKSEETYDGSGVYEITLFDNGVHRGLDPNGTYPESEMYSRMVCYRIDENNMTVEQVWDFGEELGRDGLSTAHGSTEYIAASNTYVGNFDGYVNRNSNSGIYENIYDPVRIIEVSEAKEILFELQITNTWCYRTDKITAGTLYKSWKGLDTEQGQYIYVGTDIVEYEDTAIENEPVLYRINSISATQNYLNVTGWAATEAALSGGYAAAKLLLTNQNTGDAYVYQMVSDGAQRYNSDASAEITNLLDPNTGFAGNRLNISTLDVGDYQISILVCQNGKEYCVDTEKVLRISSDIDAVAVEDALVEQDAVSATLMGLLDSGAYTLNKPYIAVNPYDIAPLSAIALFETSQPASISVSVAGKNGAATVTNEFETVTTAHQIPIYGLYAGEATEVTFTAYYENGTTESHTVSVSGNSLPSDFVPVTVTEANTAEMAQGWTFVIAGSAQAYTYAIDEMGQVRWIITPKGVGTASGLLPLSNGNYLVGGDKIFGSYYLYNLYEINLTGQIVNEYLIDGYHHDVAELPNGNLLMLVNNINGEIVEDSVYEVDRNTGAIVRTWDLNGYFNVGNYSAEGQHIADETYGAGTLDWLHTNGLAYDKQTDSVLISCRQQDAVFSMSLATGEINWILSDHDDLWPAYLEQKLLTPIGDDFEWQYGQHNISMLPNGDILLFDNGDYRSKNPETAVPANDGYSRAVVYSIDQEAMTVKQVWQWGKEQGSEILAAYVSSAQYLGEDHYLIDFGGIVKDQNGQPTYNIFDGIQGSSQSQIFEIKDGKIVFHAGVERNGLLGNTFRAERFMPYTSNQELDLSIGGNRLGSLYCYGLAQKVNVNAASALANGPEVQVVDNGVQLQISSDSPFLNGSAALALLLDGESADYKVVLPSGSSISYTLNHSEVPSGKYRLYLQNGNTVYDLKQEWYNATTARAFPAGYKVVLNSNLASGVATYGSGTYYANTPFTVWVDCDYDTEFEGWYSDGTLISTEKTLTLTATKDMNLTAVFDTEGVFTDVFKQDWFAEAVSYVNDNGLMNGTGDGKFSPNATASRAMIVTILYRLEGEPTVGEPTFGDVALGQWYTDAIAWASENNIVNGHSAEKFAPNDSVTREQLAAILYRYAMYKGYDVTETGSLSAYDDADTVSAWAVEAMTWANAVGLINGVSGDTLAPTGNATRAQVATILMRYCSNIVEVTA